MSDDPAAEIEQGLEKLGDSFRQAFADAPSEQSLRDAHARVLGKKGELTQLLRRMGALPAEQRKVVGHAVRAMYMYTAMADLAADLGDESLKSTLEILWRDVTVLRVATDRGRCRRRSRIRACRGK